MFIKIEKDGSLSLEEHLQFKSFSITDLTDNQNRKQLDAISQPAEDNHYWIDAKAVIKLSTESTSEVWIDQFRSMLKAVEPYGYYDAQGDLVKAHIEVQTETDNQG